MLSSIPLESSPPESGKVIYQKVSEITGIPDPYKEIKRENTERVLTLYPSSKNEFKKIYDNAEFIISKGQGNYEALSNERRPIFFLLKVKCHVIAKDIGVDEGGIILKNSEFRDLMNMNCSKTLR
ncbi:MAG: ARMT1-like domain-containing protein [Pseudomonadota bacterium]